MATFIPSIQKIQQFKVQPTEGEWALLHFLERTLDDSFEVYFNPFLNGDRPDIIVMREKGGVMIIEVKDWDLDSYYIDENKHWRLKNPQDQMQAKTKLCSPIKQVFKYKENLFDLHIPGLLELKIKDIRNFNFVTCAVYFHNANERQLHDFIIEPFRNDRRYIDSIKYNIDLLGRDSLTKQNFEKILRNRYIINDRGSFYFTTEIYNSFKQHLTPTRHLMSQGEDVKYSDEQKYLIYRHPGKSWRVKGVVGSGKTTVLAAKAVESVKRVLAEGREPNILILTYNITLKNFIHDKISRVRADFDWDSFTILNYHSFIGQKMNEADIPFVLPTQQPSESNRQYMQRISNYLDKEYYSNRDLFKGREALLTKYDAILIDEIQDYTRPWMDIVHDYFLVDNGEYYLFGDVKQNIYSRAISQKDVSTNIPGRPNELKTCFRADMKVRDLAVGFQREYFSDKYEIDTLVSEQDQPSLFERDALQHGSLRYIYLQTTDYIISLYNIIWGNIHNSENCNVNPNDITILGANIETLKRLDSFFRYKSNLKTTTMFETYDVMFIKHLNYITEQSSPQWINELFKLIGQDKNPKRAKGNQILAAFLARYELYREYPGIFGEIIEALCRRARFDFKDFLKILAKYESEYLDFKNKVFDANSEYDDIRENKKLHFHMNSGTIKISSVHSFKGWESELVFLLIEGKGAETSFDELLYTGITRTRSNLIVINLGNEEYHENMKQLIETYK